MPFETLFPVWDKLTPEQQRTLKNAAILRKASKGTIVHDGAADCLGYLLVRSGQLRAYFLRKKAGRSPCTGCLSGMPVCWQPPA